MACHGAGHLLHELGDHRWWYPDTRCFSEFSCGGTDFRVSEARQEPMDWSESEMTNSPSRGLPASCRGYPPVNQWDGGHRYVLGILLGQQGRIFWFPEISDTQSWKVHRHCQNDAVCFAVSCQIPMSGARARIRLFASGLFKSTRSHLLRGRFSHGSKVQAVQSLWEKSEVLMMFRALRFWFWNFRHRKLLVAKKPLGIVWTRVPQFSHGLLGAHQPFSGTWVNHMSSAKNPLILELLQTC
jgi:hypothetical protein